MHALVAASAHAGISAGLSGTGLGGLPRGTRPFPCRMLSARFMPSLMPRLRWRETNTSVVCRLQAVILTQILART